MKKKLDLEQKIREAEAAIGDEWIELGKSILFKAREAKSVLSENRVPELPALLKTIGSNHLLESSRTSTVAKLTWLPDAENPGMQEVLAPQDQ
jgi:hypothetical protein